ncbi:MAG: FkbM family methyltransferase [Crocinitomicaceae bacterium]
MKNTVKYFLQSFFGYKRYLYLFSIFKIRTLHWDKNERDFFHFLNQISDSDGVILDIGANIGIMTCHLSKKYPKREIISFEPESINFEVLSNICHKFQLDNVTLIPKALGETTGKVKMILPIQGKTKMQGLAHIKHDSIELWNEGEEYEVEIETLDSLFKNQKIAAIKMDVENFEFFVLKGGKEIIQRDRPVIYVELWDNENRVKCFEFIRSLGYQVYVLENNILTLFDSTIHKQHNFTFVPK